MIDKKIFMLCEKIEEDRLNYLNGDYTSQEKKDGERVISVILNSEVIMFNRRGKIVNFHFSEVEKELKNFPDCIIDGEVCAFDSRFESLQSRALTQNKFKMLELEKRIPCIYWVFDILKIGEMDLTKFHLRNRIAELEKLNYSEHIKLLPFESITESLFNAKQKDAEGIVIKDLNGKYESRRSRSWLKCKFFHETTMILISYTTNNAGIRCEDRLGNAVQVAGFNSIEVRKAIEEKGYCEVYIQYLKETENNRYRFISFRGVKS